MFCRLSRPEEMSEEQLHRTVRLYEIGFFDVFGHYVRPARNTGLGDYLAELAGRGTQAPW